MSIYMLNLVFDPTNSDETNNGSFLAYDNTQPLLLQSKVWLEANCATPDYDNPADWQMLEQDTSLLNLEVNDQVAIRVCSLTPVTGYVGKMTVVLARNTRRAWRGPDERPIQTHGSPFAMAPGSQQSAVLYHGATWCPPNTAGSWTWNLGPATITTPPPQPKPPGFHDSYSVIAGLTAGPGSTSGPTEFFIYSHDPDMNVNC